MYQLLMHCTNPRCANLVYLKESVDAEWLDVPADLPPRGRYCVPCARTMGHLDAADVERLHALLIEAGLLGEFGPVAPDPVDEVIVPIVYHQGRFSLL